MEIKADIKENFILKLDSALMQLLLKDNSTGKTLIWATDEYLKNGIAYSKDSHITIFSVTGKYGNLIKPRVVKSKQTKLTRIRDKAEVFTPSWVCNSQNNLVDNAWFGRQNVFNTESERDWKTANGRIEFPDTDGKTWQDYVKAVRLEITCGEAPYLTSRYDTVSGDPIPVKDRIGLLDRKLRVVSENAEDEQEWLEWAKQAVKSVYGYDWQGDNVLLARENLLFTVVEFFEEKFAKPLSKSEMLVFAEILSWNIWQMDGLKGVVPNSCKNGSTTTYSLLGEESHEDVCEGCRKGSIKKHNGIYCYVMDWEKGKKVKFVSLLRRERKRVKHD